MSKSVPSPQVQRIVGLIEQQPAENLSLRALARVFGRPESFIGRLFQQETGVTVRQYVTRIRMQRAVKMIRRGDKVEAVSLEVGYKSKKSFYRQFVRHFGTTPAAYRMVPVSDEVEAALPEIPAEHRH